MRLVTLLRVLAYPVPWSVDPSADLVAALDTLGRPVAPETIVRAGYGAALCVLFVGVPVAFVAGPPVIPLVLAAALGAAHAVHAAPGLLAATRRTRAGSMAALLVGRLVLRARISPAAETAAAFAAAGDGPLAASLARHVARSRGTPATGLDAFADEWADRFPALTRAVRTVEGAPALPPADREAAFDRALSRVRTGVRDRATEAAASLRAPASALFAFGVVLPLALVGVLPAATAAGLPVSAWWLAVGYDALLPLGLCWAGVRLLARRPVAFSTARLGPTHPAVTDRRLLAVGAGVVVALVAVLSVPLVVAAWLRWPTAVGGGVGTALVVVARPTRPVRERVVAVERGLSDALALLGRRVADGEAVERALPTVADGVSDEVGTVLAAAVRRQRSLGVGVEAAFLGDHGPLAALPSARSRDAARLLGVAVREGPPAGTALESFGTHLDELRTVEREARADLRRLTGAMRHTAAVFAPLVAGATVAMFDGFAARPLGEAGVATPLRTDLLGVAVGGYVLALAVVLTALATGLERGFDPALVADRVGHALLAATGTFLAAVVLTGLLT